MCATAQQTHTQSAQGGPRQRGPGREGRSGQEGGSRLSVQEKGLKSWVLVQGRGEIKRNSIWRFRKTIYHLSRKHAGPVSLRPK